MLNTCEQTAKKKMYVKKQTNKQTRKFAEIPKWLNRILEVSKRENLFSRMTILFYYYTLYYGKAKQGRQIMRFI